MKNKKLIILTLLFNFFIPIFAGHGIGFLGLIEIFWLKFSYGIGTENFSYSLKDSYDKTLGFVALISLIGQVILILPLLFKQRFLVIFGLIFLWIGLFYLGHDLFTDIDYIGTSPSFYSLLFGFPFLINSIILSLKIKNPSKI